MSSVPNDDDAIIQHDTAMETDKQPNTQIGYSHSNARNDELELSLVEAKNKLKVSNQQVSNYRKVATFFVVVGAIPAVLLAFQILDSTGWAILSGLFFILSLLMFIASAGAQISVQKAEAEIEKLENRNQVRSIFSGDPTGTSKNEPSYFDKLVQINIENLSEYYSLVKVHTNKSFSFSVIAGLVGFVLIVIGLVFSFVNTNEQVALVAFISTGSGILIEFIAGVFFFLYNRTVIQLKEYHDSLLDVQNILLSFKIVEDTQDESVKARMMEQMLTFLMTKKIAKLQSETPEPQSQSNR